MSTTPVTVAGQSPAKNQLKIASVKRENIRRTIESINSQSNSLLLLSLQWRDLEDHFNSIFDSIAKREEEILLKSKQIEWKQKFLRNKSSEIQLKEKKIEESLRMADDRCKEIDVTYELIERCYRTVKEREKRCEEKYKELKRRFWKKEMKLKSIESKIDNRVLELDSREKKLGSIEKELWFRLEQVESKEKMLEEKEKEKEKEIQCDDDDDEQMKIEVVVDDDDDDPTYADLRLNVTMDGKALQTFLNARINDHEILRDEVICGLSLSADPAKLVLDAIQGFYPENGDAGVDLSVVRKSCVLLLEQLSRLKPRIRGPVKERAMRVAMEWKGKMKKSNDGDDCLEVVGFLHLVGTYGLIGEFSKDELLGLLESCGCYDHVPELCQNLGFNDDIHDIIQNLIHKDQPFKAIRFAHAFELFHHFPPEPILKSYLSSTFANDEKVYNKGNPPMGTQVKCLATKLAALDSVVKCIKKYDLESKYPIQPLEHLILDLKREKKKVTASLSASKAGIKIHDKEPCIGPMDPDPGLAIGSSITNSTSSESTLAHKTTQNTPSELVDLSDPSPNSSDTTGNSTSPTLFSRASMREKSGHDPVHTSETSGSILGPSSQGMKTKKRPRLSKRAPVNPHLALYTCSPVYYMGASSSYGDYILPTYSHYSWRSLHHP